jgi:hypothetical protein
MEDEDINEDEDGYGCFCEYSPGSEECERF